jgi:hypothetical protein
MAQLIEDIKIAWASLLSVEGEPILNQRMPGQCVLKLEVFAVELPDKLKRSLPMTQHESSLKNDLHFQSPCSVQLRTLALRSGATGGGLGACATGFFGAPSS